MYQMDIRIKYYVYKVPKTQLKEVKIIENF